MKNKTFILFAFSDDNKRQRCSWGQLLIVVDWSVNVVGILWGIIVICRLVHCDRLAVVTIAIYQNHSTDGDKTSSHPTDTD